jgi:hypothetical protein
MIYFIVTACLIGECPIRKSQYIRGIAQLTKMVRSMAPGAVDTPYKIIIVENNGARATFLDELCRRAGDGCCEVFYTTNNLAGVSNKGLKELRDVLDCISHYGIRDDDFIVKMTGRYVLHDDSEFMRAIRAFFCGATQPAYDCVIKYGSYLTPVDYITDDCITGLIGMRCRFVKQIESPKEHECVEWKWGKATRLIIPERILLVDTLGIDICPGSNEYFRV